MKPWRTLRRRAKLLVSLEIKSLSLMGAFYYARAEQQGTPVSYYAQPYPFAVLRDVPGGYENLFGDPSEANVEYAIRKANGCFRHLVEMFTELEECRFLELLKMPKDRAEYLLTKQAKIVAMTCTYAALKRSDFLDLNFKYDTVVFEEAAQILEIESFIPLALQRAKDIGGLVIERVVMIGDHNQLPPVVRIKRFQVLSHGPKLFLQIGTFGRSEYRFRRSRSCEKTNFKTV